MPKKKCKILKTPLHAPFFESGTRLNAIQVTIHETGSALGDILRNVKKNRHPRAYSSVSGLGSIGVAEGPANT